MADTVKVLNQAKRVLKRNQWTKNAMARDTYGRQVGPSDPRACQVCLMGAVYKAGHELGEDNVSDVIAFLDGVAQRVYGAANTASYNDSVAKSRADALSFLATATSRA